VPRLVYVTARLPHGDGEPFVITEVRALERRGWEVTLVPVRPHGGVVHADAEDLDAVEAPLFSARIAFAALAELVSNPAASLAASAAALRGRSPDILAKNLSVLPKGLWLARLVRRMEAEHLHAHWASTSSTMAMVAARASGVPWSFTAHRWDIAENNLLRLKAEKACFVRVISEHGADELRRVAGDGAKPWVLHMGVDLPSRRGDSAASRGALRVLTAARLVEKKGHADLIEAVRMLGARGVPVHADLAGDGPLGPDLRRLVTAAGLQEQVSFLGAVSHDELLDGMASGRWQVAVLPSVVTAGGELEGIPVSLVEAMACGLPAVGTSTGGVPELLRDGAGMLVPPADPGALADALASLAGNAELRARLASAGRARVEEEFAVDRVAGELEARFRGCQLSASNSA
jgi:colanic acid/amylovoran biosynthesis glycosyltransferase